MRISFFYGLMICFNVLAAYPQSISPDLEKMILTGDFALQNYVTEKYGVKVFKQDGVKRYIYCDQNNYYQILGEINYLKNNTDPEKIVCDIVQKAAHESCYEVILFVALIFSAGGAFRECLASEANSLDAKGYLFLGSLFVAGAVFCGSLLSKNFADAGSKCWHCFCNKESFTQNASFVANIEVVLQEKEEDSEALR